MMTEDQMEIIVLLLHTLRHSTPDHYGRDKSDVRDVLQALEVAGFITVPKGIIGTLQKILGEAKKG